jgi:hypothetical protein
MFSTITNIYNKKTKGPTLMELFTSTAKLIYFGGGGGGGTKLQFFFNFTSPDVFHNYHKIYIRPTHLHDVLDECIYFTRTRDVRTMQKTGTDPFNVIFSG